MECQKNMGVWLVSKKCKNKKCCVEPIEILELKSPMKKRNKAERFFNRYNHIMEFMRTVLAITTVVLQLIILYSLSN